ncbi:ChbG/HpnK family deacetylase [Beijerinckia sp. L45]|uniref:ChbG/HpnK family deacetylase n=1 Tax=Beijerinckia sp. L45 TaxID=1641855 RepID=UPI001FF07B39|nr:ChbG/HpnK family deacetylase [Beijerinckia sp. L45]
MADAQKSFSFALCADDYAMTPAVSRGILEALDAGTLSGTSVITTSPWWPESAAALRPYAERADIGLHLNLTSGAPLGPMPNLAPGNRLPPIDRFMRGGALPLAEIDLEIGRQLDTFSSVWGGPPDHLDGHQHVQVFPPIRDLVLRHLDRRGWRGKIWLRDSADHPLRILARGTTLKKALGLAWLARGAAGAAKAGGYATNDGFAGFSDFRPGEDYGAAFSRYLKRPGPRHLVMCHPGYVDDALRAIDPVTESRERELAFLLSPAFQDCLDHRGARLARFSLLPPQREKGVEVT